MTVAFFSLFGFIFLMTQYFQFIKRYGPLSAGVHLLPVATSVGIASVLGTKLAVRFGTKLVVAGGLLMVATFYGWVAAVIAPTTGYGVIAAQMVLYGIGMGFTSAPATEAIMGVVLDRQGRRRLGRQRRHAPARRNPGCRRDRQRLRLALRQPADEGPARAPARRRSPTPHTHPSGPPSRWLSASPPPAARPLAADVHQAASGAFIHGLSAGCLVAGGVALAGAIMAAILLPAQPVSTSAGHLAAEARMAEHAAAEPPGARPAGVLVD